MLMQIFSGDVIEFLANRCMTRAEICDSVRSIDVPFFIRPRITTLAI